MKLSAETARDAVKKHHGNITRAAKELGVARTTLGDALRRVTVEPMASLLIGEGDAIAVVSVGIVPSIERYATVTRVTDAEITIEHRGLASVFDRASRACVESEMGTMRGYVLAPELA